MHLGSRGWVATCKQQLGWAIGWGCCTRCAPAVCGGGPVKLNCTDTAAHLVCAGRGRAHPPRDISKPWLLASQMPHFEVSSKFSLQHVRRLWTSASTACTWLTEMRSRGCRPSSRPQTSSGGQLRCAVSRWPVPVPCCAVLQTAQTVITPRLQQAIKLHSPSFFMQAGGRRVLVDCQLQAVHDCCL